MNIPYYVEFIPPLFVVIGMGVYYKFSSNKRKQTKLIEQTNASSQQIDVDDLFFTTTLNKQKEIEDKRKAAQIEQEEKDKQRKLEEEQKDKQRKLEEEQFTRELTSKHFPQAFSYLANELAANNLDPNGKYLYHFSLSNSDIDIAQVDWKIFKQEFITILSQKNIKYKLSNSDINNKLMYPNYSIHIEIESLRAYFNRLKEERTGNKTETITTAPYR